MTYVLIVAALLSAVAAAFGETSREIKGKRQLTKVGMLVVFAAFAIAIASVFISIRIDRERKRELLAIDRIRSIWEPQLMRAVGKTRTLVRYLAVNARLEQTRGPNPIPYDASGVVKRGSIEVLGVEPGPAISRDEMIGLLGQFSVNPPRFPWLAWRLPPSPRLRRYQSIDHRVTTIASEVLTSIDDIVEEFGDVMDQEERASIEEFRKSAFLDHLANIREIAADARKREASDNYPVCVLQPGLQGAPSEAFEQLLELLDSFRTISR